MVLLESARVTYIKVMHSYEKSRVISAEVNTGGETTESARDLCGQLLWYTGGWVVE